MNKKITAVTLTALMVLTMFTAMVPAASAVKEVSAPYEFIGVVNDTLDPQSDKYFIVSAKSISHPSLLYYDIDDKDGNESLYFHTLATDEHTIADGNLNYTTTLWKDGGYEYISWLGDKYRKVTGEWVISEELVDEDKDDDHSIRVGETLSLPGGFAITATEIDVEGEEAWLSLTHDGEEIDNEVVSTASGKDNNFVYEDDFDEADDVEIMKFTVETVFAGMNTNLVKINNISLVSMDLLEIETGSDEPFNDYDTSIIGDDTIEIQSDDDISLKEDGTTEIFDGRFLVRVNEDGDLAALVREITEPGIHELLGVVNDTLDPQSDKYFNVSAKSISHPSLLYFDLDDKDGNESLKFHTLATDEHTIDDGNLTYTTTLWIDDGYEYISWLGDKYRKVTGEWVISEELVDEDKDDDHSIRVGETLSLPGGFAITATEIDVEGEEAWLSLTHDGEEIDNEVVSTASGKDNNFVYEDDFDEADDVEIMKFTVETVFAGMNTNLVKINNISLVSMDLLEIETGSDEPFNDYDTSIIGDDTIEIQSDDDISLKEDGTTEILDGRFLVRVNEDGDLAAVAKVINIGGVVQTPTGTPISNVTATPTDTTTPVDPGDPNVTSTATVPPTAEPTPTPEPTKEPGFEAVFAVAGLLAVAYLVLRQRE